MPTVIARGDEPIRSREHEMVGVAGVFEQALRPWESTVSERSGRYRQRAQGQAARELSSKPRLRHVFTLETGASRRNRVLSGAKRHARCVEATVARQRERRENKHARAEIFEDRMGSEVLPALPWSEWRSTIDTLHMWTQIVGKVRLAYAPMMNEWWQVPLYVTSRGLTTSPIPLGARSFEISFDFIDHNLSIVTSQGGAKVLPLMPRSVKDSHSEFTSAMKALGIEVNIWTRPVEVKNPIPFEQDELHASYDPEFVRKFHDVLVHTDMALKSFRAKFTGKASPVQFFWGTFDLSVALFSGRASAVTPRDRITRVAFADEQIECGFWPGDERLEAPAYFSFAYPEPRTLGEGHVRPPAAWWHDELREFVVLYDDVRKADSPTEALAQFFESTYEAAADLLGWNRSELERMPKLGG